MVRFPARLVVPACLALNLVSNIAIVRANVILIARFFFAFGTVLTVFHFVATSLLLLVCLGLRVFEFKRLPIPKVVEVSLAVCGFVGMTQASLVYGSVGCYQLMKVLTTPLLVIMQSSFYGQRFPMMTKAALGLICVGVTIGTVSDPQASLLGTVVVLSALLITCQYLIRVEAALEELKCNAFQLLFYVAPISAVMLMPVAYICDDMGNSFYWPCLDVSLMILRTCFLAFLVNISTFLVIGKTSPVTYTVLGHTKLIVMLLIGLYMGEKLTTKKAICIVMTLAGVVWYTGLKWRGAATVAPVFVPKSPSADELEVITQHGNTDDSAEGGQRRALAHRSVA